MSQDVPLTPGRVSEMTGVSTRCLVDWRQRGYLPPLERIPRGSGQGSGARYAWPDDQIVGHVAMLTAMLDVRGRMDSASVMAWLAGFECPLPDMRSRWAAFEGLNLDAARRYAGNGLPTTLAQAVPVLVAEARSLAERRGITEEAAETLVRMQVDPAFDALTLRPRQVDALRAFYASQMQATDELVVPLLTTANVQAVLVAVQDAWSGPRLVALIGQLPGEVLGQAHRDVRVLLAPLRSLLDDPAREFSNEHWWWLPSVMYRLGRQLLLLSIQLRRNGFAERVDATVTAVAALVNDPAVRQTVALLREHSGTWLEGGLDQAAATQGLQQAFAGEACLTQSGTAAKALFSTLAEQWGPAVTGRLDQWADDLNQTTDGIE